MRLQISLLKMKINSEPRERERKVISLFDSFCMLNNDWSSGSNIGGFIIICKRKKEENKREGGEDRKILSETFQKLIL